jgi:hypothetical protein
LLRFTNRDLTALAKEMVRNASLRILTAKQAELGGCQIECPNSDEDGCKACPRSKEKEKLVETLVIPPLIEEDLTRALSTIRSSITDAREYCNYLAYWKFGTTLSKLSD